MSVVESKATTLFCYMDVDLIKKQLDDCLITSDRLLSGTKLVDETSRMSADYLDPRHFPFYYHLGKQLTPKRFVKLVQG